VIHAVSSGGGRLGPNFPLLRELEPQLGEQGGVGHALPPQAGQHSLVLTVVLAQRLKSTQYLHQCCGSVTFWYGSGCGSGSSDLYLCLTDPDANPGGPKHTDPVDPDPEHW
jgi:hypothetical protein